MSQAKVICGAGKHTTIFVVDDEPMLLDLAVAILEPLGFEVRTFRDPESALAELPTARPAVVVTDYAMATMNGIDLIHKCKHLIPDQKTLLLSGTVDQTIYANDAVKPDAFLAKPYQVGDFIKSVTDLASS